MVHHHTVHRESFASSCAELQHLLLSHFFVSLVLESQHRLPFKVIARRAHEQGDGTSAVSTRKAIARLDAKLVVCQQHEVLPPSLALTRGHGDLSPTDWRDDSDLVRG